MLSVISDRHYSTYYLLTMQIVSSVYRSFYQHFWDKFFQDEWSTRKPVRKYSQLVFNAKDQKGSLLIIEKVLKFSGLVDTIYFYRKYNDLDPMERKKGEVDTYALMAALEYLGYTDEASNKNNDNLLLRTFQLLKKYIKEKCLEFAEAQMKLTKMEIESLDDKGDIEQTSEEKPDPVTKNNLYDHEQDVKFTILSFYERIGCGEYKDAWELMSAEFQNRTPWLGDIERFIEGYTNTNGVKNILVFKVEKRFSTVFEAMVYYEDEIAAFTSAEISPLSSMTVADIDTCVKNIKQLQTKVEENGGNNFEKIELYKLFEHASSEYIWYKCGVKSSSLPNLFSARKSVLIHRLYYCTCKLVNDKWYITGIRGVPIQSAR